MALPMPRALSAVGTMKTDFLYMSTPGFSVYMPETAGIPSFFCTASATPPEAVP